MVFRSEVWDLDLLVHGDDFFAVGTRTELFAFAEHVDDAFRTSLIGMTGPRCDGKSMKKPKGVVSSRKGEFEISQNRAVTTGFVTNRCQSRREGTQ